MTEEKLESVMNELAKGTGEAVRPGLAEDIKRQIPERLVPHRGGMNTISIIVDLRVNRLAAAAVIIITTLLLANFLRDRDAAGDGIMEDSRLLLKYALGGESVGREQILEGVSRFREYLIQQGREVVYYGDGDIVDTEDSNAVLMQWRVSDGKYRVIFSDLHQREVSADELIELQAQMLQKVIE